MADIVRIFHNFIPPRCLIQSVECNRHEDVFVPAGFGFGIFLFMMENTNDNTSRLFERFGRWKEC